MRQRKRNMYYFTEDLWAIILAKLPLKIVTSFKLVCKQWTSIVESTFFRDLFISQHQYSSWSLMGEDCRTEVLAQYRCDTWGLERSPGSYISSFLTDKFENQKNKYRHGRVVAYSDAGLILIRAVPVIGNLSFYVANPVSGEYLEIIPSLFWPLGIATRIDNGGILSYRVVSYDGFKKDGDSYILSLRIYSSETGLWNPETVHLPCFFRFEDNYYSISLSGNLHLVVTYDTDNVEVVFSINYDATCRVTPFPDSKKIPIFKRCCTTSQGNLMYMNVFSQYKYHGQNLEHKLCVWTLKSWEWQLVSEIFMETDYIPVAINPFDATTAYVRSTNHQSLLSVNLDNGEFVLHDELERSSEGRILSSVIWPKGFSEFKVSSFVLPQWLHRIPTTVRRV